MKKAISILVLLLPLLFAWDGRCPVCKDNGMKSNVYIRMSYRTCMGTYAYYDTSGVYHYVDPNLTVTDYYCGHGHAFNITAGPDSTWVTILEAIPNVDAVRWYSADARFEAETLYSTDVECDSFNFFTKDDTTFLFDYGHEKEE